MKVMANERTGRKRENVDASLGECSSHGSRSKIDFGVERRERLEEKKRVSMCYRCT